MVLPIDGADGQPSFTDGAPEVRLVQLSMTLGAAEVLGKDGCGWLLEAIASHEAVDEKVAGADFKIWTVEREEGFEGVILSCWIDIDRDRPSGEQPDGLLLASHRVEKARFPFDSVALDVHGRFALFSENGVLMLPEEN